VKGLLKEGEKPKGGAKPAAIAAAKPVVKSPK